MGYTNYWYREQSIPPESYENILDDFKKLYGSIHGETPLYGGDGRNEPIMDDDYVLFNGDRSKEEDHESFYFPQTIQEEDKPYITKEGEYFQFCKTARKPYDIWVKAFLIIAKYWLEDDITINSDSRDTNSELWVKAYCLVEDHLGDDYVDEFYEGDEKPGPAFDVEASIRTDGDNLYTVLVEGVPIAYDLPLNQAMEYLESYLEERSEGE